MDCGLTCENPNPANDECDFKNCKRGCFCKWRYLRETASGECIAKQKCETDYNNQQTESLKNKTKDFLKSLKKFNNVYRATLVVNE